MSTIRNLGRRLMALPEAVRDQFIAWMVEKGYVGSETVEKAENWKHVNDTLDLLESFVLRPSTASRQLLYVSQEEETVTWMLKAQTAIRSRTGGVDSIAEDVIADNLTMAAAGDMIEMLAANLGYRWKGETNDSGH